MKISKRQLRRIIKEYGGRPYDPMEYPAGMDTRGYNPVTGDIPQGYTEEDMHLDNYDSWTKETGQVTPAASSVMATYFVEQGLQDDHKLHELIASSFGVDPEDVMRDIKRQQKEYEAGGVLSDEEDYERGFKESISRRGSKLLNESLQSAEERLFHALDEYVMILDEKMGYDIPDEQLRAEVDNFVDGYFFDRDFQHGSGAE